ncbi:MAG: acetyltransferase [Elusimicrobia bacterium]|nr:acetyltransferase [Elusimicrobiota bacterium]
MRRIAIVGAGGHGREVADVLRHAARAGEALSIEGFIDENESLHGREIEGLPALGGWEWFDRPARREVQVVCAVGAPNICRKLVLRARALGLSFGDAISPLACVSPGAKLGAGITLFPHAVVGVGARLGNHCILNLGASVSHDSVVGDFTILNPGARLAGNVMVGEGCNIGMQSSVIQGRTVGAWTTIGAGAAVVRDIPPGVTAVGVPARPLAVRRTLGAGAQSAVRAITQAVTPNS